MPILCTFYLNRKSSDEVEINDITLRLTPDNEKSLFSGKKGFCKYIEQLSQVSNDTYKLPAGSADLSAYLYALSTHNRLPDRGTIAELISCNATVNQVREKFKNGRANIISDIIKRPQIACEMYYARKHLFKEEESNEMVIAYARSLFVDFSLCGEMAVLAATEHSQSPQSQGPVSRVSSDAYKHAWAETDRCVIDPWAGYSERGCLF
ncbi:hypothetical protein ABK905_01565 [Acerihabitans sp. KWT182]|uniref:Uncharacterized protein n=1 Tax=Acerihabitans sp. KWT182 TaxID=3157919 RepID=A0AAU7Q9Y9_9GAMM